MTTTTSITANLATVLIGLALLPGCTGSKPSWKTVSQKHLESHLAEHRFSYNSAFVNNAGLIEIDARGLPVSDVSCLEALPLEVLLLAETRVTDLGPLRELRTLTKLNLSRAPVADLTPIGDLNISWLDISATRVTELSALQNLRLSYLNVANTHITDLTPINAEALRTLNLVDADIRDLTPLARASELESIYFSPQQFSDAKEQLQILRNMKTLTCVNFYSNPEQFWKEYDSGKLAEGRH